MATDSVIRVSDHTRRGVLAWNFVLLALSILFWNISASAQVTSNFFNDGTDNLRANPANMALDSTEQWAANLFSIHTSAGSNTANLGLKDLIRWNGPLLRQNVFGTKSISTGWARAVLAGPAFSFKPNVNSTITVSTRMRILGNYWNVDSRILAEIGEVNKNTHSYPYSLAPSIRMKTNIAAVSDIGITYSRQVLATDKYRLHLGATFRYVSGTAHSTLDIQNLSGLVSLNRISTTSYLSASEGSLRTRTSGHLLDEFTAGNWFNGGRSTVSADFGLTYQYGPSEKEAYRYKIGLSVTDVGKINYRADSAWSKSYDVHIPATNAGLYFNANFKNSSLSQTSKVFDRYKQYFTNTAKDNGNYSIGLPTTLQAFVDYRITDNFFVNADAIFGLRGHNSLAHLYANHYAAISPRWLKNKFSISLPISYQNFGGLNAGLGLEWKNLFFTSRSLFTAINGTNKLLDLHLGASFQGIAGRRTTRSRVIEHRKDELERSEEELKTSTEAAPSLPARQFKLSTAVIATATTQGTVPFWLRTNQFGSTPISGASVSIIPTISKEYDPTRKNRLLDWGMGLEGRYNAGNQSEIILTEGYLKGRLGILQAKVGRSKDVTGLLADTTMSVGSFAISGNALGIPKVEIVIPDYYYVPFLRNLFALKANFAHGWLGTLPLGASRNGASNLNEAFTYFHQKSLYVKFGKPEWRFHLYGGFNHQAFWSDTDKIYGPTKSTLSRAETFWYVVAGKRYGEGLVEISKLGNHLGSIDLGAEYEFENVKMVLARQNLYDVGALSKLANIRDGLNAVSLENKKASDGPIRWKKVLLEYFYSANQAGELWSKYTRSGDENYYNNYLYPTGWSYRGYSLGTPIITTRDEAKDGQVSRASEFFINNRVKAANFSLLGTMSKIDFLAKFVYSSNKGTYGSSAIGSSLGGVRYVSDPPYFKKVDQFSGYLELSKKLKNNFKLGIVVAGDAGKLLNDSFGSSIRLTKSWK